MPIIIATARSHVQDRIKGLRAGADDFVVKPYDVRVANSRFGERQSTHRIARFRRPESMEPPGRRSVAALYSQ